MPPERAKTGHVSTLVADWSSKMAKLAYKRVPASSVNICFKGRSFLELAITSC